MPQVLSSYSDFGAPVSALAVAAGRLGNTQLGRRLRPIRSTEPRAAVRPAAYGRARISRVIQGIDLLLVEKRRTHFSSWLEVAHVVCAVDVRGGDWPQQTDCSADGRKRGRRYFKAGGFRDPAASRSP
jgi:hypothetical protein